MRSILLVCTANICRSPMAEGVLRKRLADRGLGKRFKVASAGTHDYHVGKPPFPLAFEAAKRRGYDLAGCTARKVRPSDFDDFDMILAMDRANLSALRAIAPTRSKQKIELLTEYGDEFHGREIPDPYGRDARDFELALDIIEDGCAGLAELLARPSPGS